ncbi:MAG TPA: tetratricopeptide repeat protein [Alphaproteobacteria bacterium]
MVFFNRSILITGVLLASISLSGCESMKHTASANGDPNTATNAQLSNAIADAARDAQAGGMTQESLGFQAKLYHDDPHNPDKILNYARALRYAGRIDDAKLVIRTPAKGPRATEPMMTEAAMILISAGEYDEALEFAQMAVEKNKKSADAHHALALALSGLEKYEAAQLQFQETVKIWPEGRDQTSVINNLAMSLAAQGKIEEARTAMAMATGEALRSATYQNNRSLLEAIKDRTPVKSEKLEPIIAKPVLVHEDVAPAAKVKTDSEPAASTVAVTKTETKTKTTIAKRVRGTTPASQVKAKTQDVPADIEPAAAPSAQPARNPANKMAPIVE